MIILILITSSKEKKRKSNFGDFEYLVWLESYFQVISIDFYIIYNSHKSHFQKPALDYM